MIIIKPFTADIDPQNRLTTNLHFDNGAVKRFYMKGAIAWPSESEGFALMAGYDIDEMKVIIFEQFRFWTVSHWLNSDGTIHERKREPGQPVEYHLGLVQFLVDNLAKYRCCSYFWGGQHIDVWNRFGREVYQHKMTPKRIEMIEVPYVTENGPGILSEKLKTNRFHGEVDSLLHKSVAQFQGMQAAGGKYDNAVLALMTLLTGYEFCPWVERKAA